MEWLSDFDYDVDTSEVGGCANIKSSECDPNVAMSCDEFFDRTMEIGWAFTGAYWALEAVKKCHQKMQMVRDSILEETVLSGFKVADMVDDLEGKDKTDKDTLAILAGAFALVGGLGGAVAAPGVSADSPPPHSSLARGGSYC